MSHGSICQGFNWLSFRHRRETIKKNAEERYHAYNENRPRKERLKGGDLQLLTYLIEIAAADLRDHQGQKNLHPYQHLPFFRASNPLLAKKVGCTEKTVQNRRKRLTQAGFITGYRFRTTGQKYDLRLSTDLLHINQPGKDENLSDHFYPRLDAPLGSPAYEEKFTSLCNLLLNQNSIKQIQQESGVGTADDSPFSGLLAELEPFGAGDTPDNPSPTKNQAGNPGNYAAAAKKYDQHGRLTVAPICWGQVTESLKPEEERQLRQAVNRLWTKCSNWNWYNTGRVAESQANLAQIRLAEWFLLYYPSAWKALEKRFSWQLKRVSDYTKWRETNEKHSRKGKESARLIWFPSPGDYFDIRKKDGMCFSKTNAWWKQRLERLSSQEQDAALGKAISAMKTAGFVDDPYAVEATYNTELERLAALNQDDLITQFIHQVTEMYGNVNDLLP